jgi:hypothetical protein
VPEEGGETAVGLGEDAVLLVDGEELVELGEDVGMELYEGRGKGRKKGGNWG